MALTVIVVLKTLAEIAGLALLGQGVLHVFAGANRDKNFFYRILKTVTQPVWRLTRLITPRVIIDRHIGLLSFLLVAVAWYFLLVAQVAQCLTSLKHPVCEALLVEYVSRCEQGNGEACEVLRRNDVVPPVLR
ncbi:MAG: hypothetical protein OEM83_08345 [Gammaproteobacteria bacterium]|nr:hypothetical protein [Gammaproteobacteria bacterium]MDH5512316.1 hypothetical protein [Gammaproteobacteria bacterium]